MKPSAFLAVAFPFSCLPASTLSNNNIEPLTATGSAGQRVDFGKTDVSDNQMTVSLRQSGAGTYHAAWQVLSVDSTRQTPIPSLAHFQTIRSPHGR